MQCSIWSEKFLNRRQKFSNGKFQFTLPLASYQLWTSHSWLLKVWWSLQGSPDKRAKNSVEFFGVHVTTFSALIYNPGLSFVSWVSWASAQLCFISLPLWNSVWLSPWFSQTWTSHWPTSKTQLPGLIIHRLLAPVLALLMLTAHSISSRHSSSPSWLHLC